MKHKKSRNNSVPPQIAICLVCNTKLKTGDPGVSIWTFDTPLNSEHLGGVHLRCIANPQIVTEPDPLPHQVHNHDYDPSCREFVRNGIVYGECITG